MIHLIVDTDIVSYIFKWHPSAPHYIELLAGNEVAISFVTPAEMRFGALEAGWGIRRTNLLERFLSRFMVYYPDDRLCAVWAEIKHESNQKGHPISTHDAWIAATALNLRAALFTNNTKHFAHLERLKLYGNTRSL